MIVIKSIEAGWLELEIVADPAGEAVSMKLPASSCDPLVELPETALKIASCYDADGNFSSREEKFFTFWEAEKQMYTCMFVPGNDWRVKVELSCCSDIYAGIHTRDEVKFSTTIRLRDLISNIHEEMKFMLRHCGFSGYRKKWGKSGFPVDLFLKLHGWLTTGRITDLTLAEEIAALQSIFVDKTVSGRE